MSRPLFTQQEYDTIRAALDLVKDMRESSGSSLAERRYAGSLLPSMSSHIALLDKLAANTERKSAADGGDKT